MGIRPSLHWSLKEKGSCPQCPCDCSKDFDPIPVGEIHFSMIVNAVISNIEMLVQFELTIVLEGMFLFLVLQSKLLN